MIRTRQELKHYLKKEKALYYGESSLLRRFVIRLQKGDAFCAYEILKALRNYEYNLNINSPFKTLYKIIFKRKCFKYNISLPVNAIGCGLRLPHLVGGELSLIA